MFVVYTVFPCLFHSFAAPVSHLCSKIERNEVWLKTFAQYCIKIGKMGPKIAEQLSFLLFALGFTLNYMNQAQGGHRSSVVSPEFPALNLKADASSG